MCMMVCFFFARERSDHRRSPVIKLRYEISQIHKAQVCDYNRAMRDNQRGIKCFY